MDTWQGLTPAVHPSMRSSSDVDVVITFRSATSPIYLSVDAVNHWEPQLMSSNGEAYEHVITVPRDTRLILYKFRIGDTQWVHDAGICAEPDNFGGWNNRFEWNPEHIPQAPAHAPSEFSEDTEMESVLGVESVADTISEYADEDGYHDEPVEFVDMHDVDDPEFPAGMLLSSSLTSCV